MARKQQVEDDKIWSIRLDVSADCRRKLRQVAASADVPMSQYVRTLVEREVNREFQKEFGK